MNAPAGIVANLAIARQNIALSFIKQSNDQQKALINILDQSVRMVAASNKGVSVNRLI